MADAIPGSSVLVLDGVAHLGGLEDPMLVSGIVEDFLFEDGESGSAAL